MIEVSWHLLLNDDPHMVLSSASVFVVACVRRTEDALEVMKKVPPPSIDFTLPSPAIGQSQLPVVDPPWMPHLKTKIEELSLKEEELPRFGNVMPNMDLFM
ncbi:unnamed protein product [Strongylus vulgaris]|uniref:Protein UNC80 central region domain-containing protein n=1 Tax=Strongylus vulgaris TaxID=40348 RepID=A0A3P7LU57_STRVU|nr:unnamed protein product [Strongylus vulgaris]